MYGPSGVPPIYIFDALEGLLICHLTTCTRKLPGSYQRPDLQPMSQCAVLSAHNFVKNILTRQISIRPHTTMNQQTGPSATQKVENVGTDIKNAVCDSRGQF